MRGRICSLAAGVLVLAGCGATAAPTPDPNAAARLMRIDELAAGTLGALPTGTQFVRFAVFHQMPGATTPSKKHQPGIVFEQAGEQELITTGENMEITAGEALFQGSVAHSHSNNGTTVNEWYFIALWPSVQRLLPLVGTSRVAYETEDISSSILQPGAYVETLRRVALQSGGRSPAHRFGGLEAIYVLDGTLTVDAAGKAPAVVPAGQGAFLAPNTLTQELASSGAVTYLAFFVTPVHTPFETISTAVP